MSSNLEEIIQHWFESSKDDFDSALKLFDLGKFHHSLFFVHLSLEKLLKGLFLQRNGRPPSPTHDLVRLAEEAEVLTEDLKSQLAEVSTFNIAARYDDYKLEFYKKATKEYAQNWIGIAKNICKQLTLPK